MTTFFDLFTRASRSPEVWTDPTWADRHFPALVASSPLQIWQPGDPVATRGSRLLIGVATWAGYDMRLLDIIGEAMSREGAKAPIVEIFNVADCRQPSDFRVYLPTVRTVLQTPVVGLWRDGRLESTSEGYEAREKVARLFGSSSSEIVDYVQDWIKARSLNKGA